MELKLGQIVVIDLPECECPKCGNEHVLDFGPPGEMHERA